MIKKIALLIACAGILFACQKPNQDSVFSVTSPNGQDISTELIFSQQGGTKSVKVVSSTAAWKLSSCPNWVTVNPSQGNAGPTIVLITVGTNNTGAVRNSKVVFKDGNDSTREINISQTISTLTLSSSSYSFAYNVSGGSSSKTCNVTTNESSWTYSVTGTHVADFDVSRSGNTITVYPKSTNDSNAQRTCTITVTAGALKETISVAQGPGPTKGTLTILSANVQGLPNKIAGFSLSGIVSSQAGSKAFSNAVSDHYDIVGLQEDFIYHDYIMAENLGKNMPYITDPSASALFGFPYLAGSGVNIFSKYEFIGGTGTPKKYNADREEWKDKAGGLIDGASGTGQDALSAKGFVRSQINLKGKTVYIYDIHTDAGSEMGDKTARTSNFNQLSTNIAKLPAGSPVIVLGDFNETYTNGSGNIYNLCQTHGLTDLSYILGGSNSIDRIVFRSGNGVTFTAKKFSLKSQTDLGVGMTYSDHPAAYGELDFTIN